MAQKLVQQHLDKHAPQPEVRDEGVYCESWRKFEVIESCDSAPLCFHFTLVQAGNAYHSVHGHIPLFYAVRDVSQ